MDWSKTVNAGKVNYKDIELIKLKEFNLVRWQTKFIAVGIEFVSLFLFWILLSGRYQVKYLLIGAVACSIITYLTHDLMYNPGPRNIASGAGFTLYCCVRLIAYIPWLVWAIIKANIQVAMIILKPKMPIDPGLFQFKTLMTSKISLVTLANSITLTPGTITIDLQNDTFILHAIVRGAASDLESGLMQNKVGAIFRDWKDPAPTCLWAPSRKELEK